MALNAATASGAKSKDYTPVAAGTYPGYFVQIVDIGMQPRFAFQGEDKPPMQHVILTYELSDEFMKDEDGQDQEDKPRWISEKLPLFNLAADRAISTIRYNVLDPSQTAGGDFTRLLGSPVNITVVNNPGKGKNAGKTFDKVQAISAMRAKDVSKMPGLKNTPRFFDLSEPDLAVFNDLPNYVKDLIKNNLEFKGSKMEALLEGSQGTGAKQEETKSTPPKQQAKVQEDDEENPF